MKKIILLLLLVISTTTKANNRHHCAIVIEQTDSGWHGQLFFNTQGLIALIQTSSIHTKFQIDETLRCNNIIKKFIQDKYSLLVNRETKVELKNFKIYPNKHATEIVFDIVKVPSKAIFWEVNANFKFDAPIDKSLIFIVSDHKNLFILENENTAVFKNDGKIVKKIS